MYSFSGAKDFRITAVLLIASQKGTLLKKAVAIGVSLCKAIFMANCECVLRKQ